MSRGHIFCALALSALAACGSKPKLTADQYYKDATSAFETKNYEVAVRSYKELLDQYPFSDHAEEAELRIAHSYYQDGQYAEAIAAFNDFQRMHPMSPHLPQVYYLLGKSYMDQMTTIDRDQGASENAHGWFRVVIDRYPSSPYAAKSQRQLAKCRRSLAEHELYIASFYLKRNNIPAGENRVRGILENYPDTNVPARALEHLAAAYSEAGDSEHEQMARAAIAEHSSVDTPLDDDSSGGWTSLSWLPLVPDETEDESNVSDEPTATIAGELVGSGTHATTTTTLAKRGPATEALLTDLAGRYGPSQGVSTATTAPSLLDPPAPPKIGPRGASTGYTPPGVDPGGY